MIRSGESARVRWSREVASMAQRFESGEIGEEIDDGRGSARQAGQLKNWDFGLAAELANERRFAGAGWSGDENDLAGGERREMGKRRGGEVGLGFEAKPSGDEGAVGQKW